MLPTQNHHGMNAVMSVVWPGRGRACFTVAALKQKFRQSLLHPVWQFGENSVIQTLFACNGPTKPCYSVLDQVLKKQMNTNPFTSMSLFTFLSLLTIAYRDINSLEKWHCLFRLPCPHTTLEQASNKQCFFGEYLLKGPLQNWHLQLPNCTRAWKLHWGVCIILEKWRSIQTEIIQCW